MNVLVLGANGLIGSALYTRLKTQEAVTVDGTSQWKTDDLLVFDVLKEDTFVNIPWNKYDVVYYCIGSIRYEPGLKASEEAQSVNVTGAIRVLSELSERQRFIYLSTHVTKLDSADHNPYSYSKQVFENYAAVNNLPIHIARLPGIYSSMRKAGLIFCLKDAFTQSKEFIFDFEAKLWHIMKLERAVDALLIFLGPIREQTVTIGYPVAVDIHDLVTFCENHYRKRITVRYMKQGKQSPIPDIKTFQQYYSITKDDCYTDFKTFLEED